MLKRAVLLLSLTAIVLVCIAPVFGQDDARDYFAHAREMLDEFERIQAGMEVAFDPSLYIGSMQNLNFEHKKFSEAYGNRKERKYLSYSLEKAIFSTYLALVTRIRSNDEVPQDVVNRVIDSNQQRISLLSQSLETEKDESPKTAWVDVIDASIKEGDYPAAREYVKLAKEVYGNEREFLELEDTIVSVITKVKGICKRCCC